jgi:transposase InsO family protein
MAIWRRGKPDALLHHSDRGSQYQIASFQNNLAIDSYPTRLNSRSPALSTNVHGRTSRRRRAAE